ncbi:MAG: hypothetical protein M0P71_18420 [Melioribacteraceae bacterium]|jgi:hypothetical protein|nr:hypothetical protein [Melioribacteraceae bacterium]
MLTPKQKVFKKIFNKWLQEYQEAAQIFRNSDRYILMDKADENKRLALLALETIYQEA